MDNGTIKYAIKQGRRTRKTYRRNSSGQITFSVQKRFEPESVEMFHGFGQLKKVLLEPPKIWISAHKMNAKNPQNLLLDETTIRRSQNNYKQLVDFGSYYCYHLLIATVIRIITGMFN